MSDDRILAIDIGAGTMDVLLYDPAQPMENAVQLVLPSATALAGKRIAAAREAIAMAREDECVRAGANRNHRREIAVEVAMPRP